MVKNSVTVGGTTFNVINNRLDLREKKITDISEIKGLETLTDLKILDLQDNLIKEINNLESLINLEQLILSNNDIEEIKGLDKLTNLKFLSLDSNRIKEIKGLNKLANLTYLSLNSNKIQEIKGLENLKNLRSINLMFNPIIEEEEKFLRQDVSLLIRYCQFKLKIYEEKTTIGNKFEDFLLWSIYIFIGLIIPISFTILTIIYNLQTIMRDVFTTFLLGAMIASLIFVIYFEWTLSGDLKGERIKEDLAFNLFRLYLTLIFPEKRWYVSNSKMIRFYREGSFKDISDPEMEKLLQTYLPEGQWDKFQRLEEKERLKGFVSNWRKNNQRIAALLRFMPEKEIDQLVIRHYSKDKGRLKIIAPASEEIGIYSLFVRIDKKLTWIFLFIPGIILNFINIIFYQTPFLFPLWVSIFTICIGLIYLFFFIYFLKEEIGKINPLRKRIEKAIEEKIRSSIQEKSDSFHKSSIFQYLVQYLQKPKILYPWVYKVYSIILILGGLISLFF